MSDDIQAPFYAPLMTNKHDRYKQIIGQLCRVVDTFYLGLLLPSLVCFVEHIGCHQFFS